MEMMTKMLFYSDFIAVSHYEATTRLSPSLLSHVISTAQDNVTMMVMMMKRWGWGGGGRREEEEMGEEEEEEEDENDLLTQTH